MSRWHAMPACFGAGLLLVYSALALSAFTPSSREPSGEPARISTWVWDRDTALNADSQRILLEFGRSKGVGTLFVQASPSYESDGQFDAFARLVQGAAQQGATVVLVGGDPSWGLSDHHPDAVDFLRLAARLGERLVQRSLPKPNRVLFDVEPYLLPEWKTSSAAVEKQYIALLEALQSEAHRASVGVWHTVPFWLSDRTVDGKSLDRVVLERSDGVVVMAYRNTTADVVSVATTTLQHAAELGKPVVVAVETMCIEPAYISFCGTSSTNFEDTLRRLASALHAFPAFAGLAVHHYPTWKAIADGHK